MKKILISDKYQIVWGAGSNGRFLGEDFFQSECDQDQRTKLMQIMASVSVTGHMSNKKNYRYPMQDLGNMGEFKVHKKRLYFYKSGNQFVITHGATKKTDLADKNDLFRLERLRSEIESGRFGSYEDDYYDYYWGDED